MTKRTRGRTATPAQPRRLNTAELVTRGMELLEQDKTAEPVERAELYVLHFPGDIREEVLADPMHEDATGVPARDGAGERVIAVSALHDPTTDRTRVGYAYATTDDIARSLARAVLAG